MGRRVIGGVLALHLVIAVVHGTTHAAIPVSLTPLQNLVVLLAVFVGPIVGVGLDWREDHRGIPVFTVSMAGGVAVGVVLHFVVENPDHVHQIPGGVWRLPFQVSALGVAVTGSIGALVGAWYWWSR